MSWLSELRTAWEPDRPAIVTDQQAISYAELDARIERAAGWLRARGVGPGAMVALQMEREPAFLELHLAALGLGACTLPLNPTYTAAELRYLLADARADLAIVLPERLALLEATPGRPIVASDAVRAALDAAAPNALPASLPDDTPAVLLYTSGTTGRPKGAVIRHGNLRATVGALREAWEMAASDVLLHALPLFHVHGLFVAQHQALLAGATAVWMDRFEPRAALREIAARRATVFMGVPTFYARLLALPDDVAPDLSSLRLVTSGSAPLPARDHAAFADRFGHRIVERYGMTEIGIVLSNPLRGERRAGSVGLPLRGVTARIVDERGDPVPDGAVGELAIRGPSVFSGYLNLPDATAAALVDGELRTGDLARRDPDGYFAIVGRKTEMILTGGLNVYPLEVEQALLLDPRIHQAAVLGVEDPDLGERVVASVVADPGLDPDHALRALRDRLAPYKCPRALALVDALPRNALGKVQKAPLRQAWSAPTVRRATPSDLDLIVDWNVAMARETEGLALDPATVRRGVGRVLRGEVAAHYYLLVRAGEPIAQCMITIEWSDWRDAEIWWFQSVRVAPRWRRRGCFRTLYAEVAALAARAGAAGLRLYVDRRNEAARATYRSLGMTDEHYITFERLFDGGPPDGP